MQTDLSSEGRGCRNWYAKTINECREQGCSSILYNVNIHTVCMYSTTLNVMDCVTSLSCEKSIENSYLPPLKILSMQPITILRNKDQMI